MAVARDADAGNVEAISVSSGGGSTVASITVGASATFLLCAIEVDTSTPGTLSVSWDFTGTPQTMTQVGTTLQVTGGNAPAAIALFGLINPTAGQKIFRITASGQATSANCYTTAISFTGTSTVSVAAATEGFASANGTTGTAAVTSAASIPTGDMAVAWFIETVTGFTSTFTPGGAQGDGGTAIAKNESGANAGAGEFYSGAGSTIAASAGLVAGANKWGAMIVGIKAPGTGDTLGGAMQAMMM